MRRHLAGVLLVGLLVASCAAPPTPTREVLGPEAPYPPTWTPTLAPQPIATSTLVVRPTPTWDGTPPPPSYAEIPRVAPARLYRELEAGSMAAVDVRNLASFRQAHISGALHIPAEDLAARVGELDRGVTIVLYDLSAASPSSLEAAMYLYGEGYVHVAVLEGGLQRWFADGYPIEGTILTPTVTATAPSWTLTPLITTTVTVTVQTPVPVTATITATATAALTATATVTASPSSK